ncbi:MAG: DUF4870 domain-containing protein [Sedimentisphaerales bacterium]|nr:DUF4870 domain-containing protein [Sedimentisphaerales bacterium]
MAKKDTPQDEAETSATEKHAESPPQPQQVTKDARRWAMFCHLAGLAWLMPWLLPVIGGVVGSLIVWQVKKDDDPFTDEAGRRAFNFQISMLIYSVGLAITVVGILLIPVVAVLDIVFTIIAAVRAADGKSYRYPLTIEFMK